MSELEQSRAVSPVLGTVLLVAVAVLAATVTAGYAFGIVGDVDGQGPTVGETSGELVSDESGSSDQIFRLTHVAGDEVAVDDIEIAVDARDACGKRSRIVSLPTETLGSANFEGADIFDHDSPEAGVLEPGGDGRWGPGETIQFRLASTECPIEPDDEVAVTVVHSPSESVVATTTLTAT